MLLLRFGGSLNGRGATRLVRSDLVRCSSNDTAVENGAVNAITEGDEVFAFILR